MTEDPPGGTAGGGRLILVVGPSGAGKDSVIRYARDRLRDDNRFVFPERVVTRPSSEAENNLEADAASFARMVAGGAFAAHWDAHGLRYGVPAAIATDLAAGRSVVCNVSRTAIGAFRQRFPRVLVVEVTARPETLEARIAARGRGADGNPAARLARSAALSCEPADVSILNEGPLDAAGARFLRVILSEAA